MTNHRSNEMRRLSDMPLDAVISAEALPAMPTSSPDGSDTQPAKFKKGVPTDRASDSFETFDLTRNRSMMPSRK